MFDELVYAVWGCIVVAFAVGLTVGWAIWG